MKQRDIRVLRTFALAGVLAASLLLAFLAAGPASAWDARIVSCVEQVFFVAFLVAFVGASLALGARRHR